MNDSDAMFSKIAGFSFGLAWLPLGLPMDPVRLNSAMIALHALPEHGVPWRSSSHIERGIISGLSRRGAIGTAGRTQAQAVRLTPAAVFAVSEPRYATSRLEIREFIELVESSQTVRTPSGQDVVMGFELVATAGHWWSRARRSDKAWQKYQCELSEMDGLLLPALILGWLRLHVASDQTAWAVSRTAIDYHEPMPFIEVDLDCVSWKSGFDMACSARSTHATGAELVHRLPAARWY